MWSVGIQQADSKLCDTYMMIGKHFHEIQVCMTTLMLHIHTCNSLCRIVSTGLLTSVDRCAPMCHTELLKPAYMLYSMYMPHTGMSGWSIDPLLIINENIKYLLYDIPMIPILYDVPTIPIWYMNTYGILMIVS